MTSRRASPSFHRIDETVFRSAMGQYPTGVAVVTTMTAKGPVGMVVGTFTSVSVDPPLVAFLARRGSVTSGQLRAAPTFVVNVLGADQIGLSRSFSAGPAADRWAGVRWYPSPVGNPVLEGVVLWVECDQHVLHEAGDHHIVVGAVRAISARSAPPLLFHRGQYRRLAVEPVVDRGHHPLPRVDLRAGQVALAERSR